MREAKDCFNKLPYVWKCGDNFSETVNLRNLTELKQFLDIVHIRSCIIQPYNEFKDYPLVDSRALLPSFDTELLEYHHLPGFSMLALERELHSFNEFFQYEQIMPLQDITFVDGPCCPLESQIINENAQTFLSRMPKNLHGEFNEKFAHTDAAALAQYPELLSLLGQMDRAHVIAQSKSRKFQMAGVFASFPSDLDGELKRFGLRIGKFQAGNSSVYQKNRLFTLQFLMELYGFPISSERRTSATLFARRLHKSGEKFMIRVMGQSDRTLTTIWSDGKSERYPYVEKIALIKIENKDVIKELKEQDAFIDKKNNVAIARVCYRQHAYSLKNVRQDRALSILSQSIIHPETGKDIPNLNFLHGTSSLILSLNDISRGEFTGSTVYKRTELIEGTDTEEKRLKTFYAWLLKHQRRIISYSDDSYKSFVLLFTNYFDTLEYIETHHPLNKLKSELVQRYTYIQQARTLRDLEDITDRNYNGKTLTYDEMLSEAVDVLQSYKFELSTYFEELVSSANTHMESILNNSYLLRNYIKKDKNHLSEKGHEIRKKYSSLVQLHDEFKAIQKARRAE